LREERKLRVFENMGLRRIFGPRRDEVTGEWRSLHNEELNDLYPSPNIVRVIKSRRMRWAGHVAHTGEEREAYRVWSGIRVAVCFSLQHGYHSNPTTPKLQHTSNEEQYDQCGNSTE